MIRTDGMISQMNHFSPSQSAFYRSEEKDGKDVETTPYSALLCGE
jgi:hypothetical protein